MQDFEVHLGLPNSPKTDWFGFPLNEEEINRIFSVENTEKEYLILDYEFPLDLEETMTIKELNRLFYKINEFPVWIAENLRDILKYFPSIYDIDENEIYVIKDCFTMEEVARYLIEEDLVFDIPNELKSFIDFRKYGEYLYKKGHWVKTRIGMCDMNYRNF